MTNQPPVTAPPMHSIDMNGLVGRMVRLPHLTGKHAEILFLHDVCSTLEYWLPFYEYFQQFGSVTAPDMPGIGGMTSFFAIHKKPTLDSYSDYIAAFIKLRYRRKRVVVIAMPFGFSVLTHMLQRNPELQKHISLIVSISGFIHHDDILLSEEQLRPLKRFSKYCKHMLPTKLFVWWSRRTVAGNMWVNNDARSHAYIVGDLLRLNNCVPQLEVPLWYIANERDQYIDMSRAEQHMRIAYHSVTVSKSRIKVPDVRYVHDPESIARLFPARLRKMIAKG